MRSMTRGPRYGPLHASQPNLAASVGCTLTVQVRAAVGLTLGAVSVLWSLASPWVPA